MKPVQNTIGQSQNAIDALGNTANPLYQRIYGQQREQGQQNLGESVAEMVRQNRKQNYLGRGALFSPERGGETLFRGVNRGYQDIQNQAANDTRGIIGNQINQYGNLANQQTGFANQQIQSSKSKAGVKGNLAGALAKLFRL